MVDCILSDGVSDALAVYTHCALRTLIWLPYTEDHGLVVMWNSCKKGRLNTF